MRAPETPVVSIDSIRAARSRIAGYCVRTPLLPLYLEAAPADIYLKCENLQPVGAFKNRPQSAVVTSLDAEEAAQGVYTASSGNSGLGMAYAARRLGIPARVYAPEPVDAAKADALETLGAEVHRVSHDEWWKIIVNAGHDEDPGVYVDAVRDPRAIAGSGSIGLEILEDLPDADVIVAPFGGGGLICGVASAVRALKPDTRIVAAEIDTARPLAAAFDAGHPVEVPVERSFVQAIGASAVLDSMWPRLGALVDQVTFATLGETCGAMRTLFERAHLIAEGAAAVALAAVLAGRVSGGKIVCIVSGGNIDPAHMAAVLEGRPPEL